MDFVEGPHLDRWIKITLVIAEGDRVTLSSNTQIQAAYATYNNQARLNGQAVTVGARGL